MTRDELLEIVKHNTFQQDAIMTAVDAYSSALIAGKPPVITDTEYEDLMKLLYPTDRSKTFRRQ